MRYQVQCVYLVHTCIIYRKTVTESDIYQQNRFEQKERPFLLATVKELFCEILAILLIILPQKSTLLLSQRPRLQLYANYSLYKCISHLHSG